MPSTSNLLSLVIAGDEESPPARIDQVSPDVNVWSTMDGDLCAVSGTEGTRHWLHWPGLASFRFAAGCDIVTAIPYRPPRLDVIRTVFHHTVLPLALQALGREGLHASAVLTDRGVVGFCGKAQTGKSTLAYALSRHGLVAWSDDALVWETHDDAPTAIMLPFEVRLRSQALAFFGHASVSDIEPAAFRGGAQAPICAVFVLTRSGLNPSGPRVQIQRLVGARALTALLDHAHCFNPYDGARTRKMMLHYLAFLDRVPVFEIQFQPALSFLPDLVDAIMDSLPADSPARCAPAPVPDTAVAI